MSNTAQNNNPECGYRHCSMAIPPSPPGSRGPRPTYCTKRCRRSERYQRDREQGRVGQHKPKSEHKAPPARYQDGHHFDGTELTLVRRAPEYEDGMAWFLCSCGHAKVARIGNVSARRTRTCGAQDRHPDNGRTAGEHIGIGARHLQLTERYGPASAWPCALCGDRGEDHHWSYRHSSSEARCQYAGHDRGQIYSLDDADYWALCRPCHARWDAAHERHAAALSPGTLSLPHVVLAAAYDPGYGMPTSEDSWSEDE